MIARGDVFPYTHDIGLLLDRAARIGEAIPDEVRSANARTATTPDDVELEP